jgi:hypothetical protein
VGPRWVTCPGRLPPRCSYGHAIIPQWFPDFRSRQCLAVYSTIRGYRISRWKMPPSITELDEADQCLRDREPLGDLSLRTLRRPYCCDRLRSELGHRVQLACRNPTAPLAAHVSHVVQLRAREEMGWIHAPRPVAAVQNAEACRNRPVRRLEGQPVRIAGPTSPPERSVAVAQTACPEPAPFRARRFVGVVIEPLLQRRAPAHLRARPLHAALGRPSIAARAAR